MKEGINSYSFKPIANPRHNVHIISISERLKRGGLSVINPHRTDFYVMQLVTRGEASHIVDFEEVMIKAGEVLFITPGQVQAFRPTEDYEGWLAAFPKDFICHTVDDENFLENALLFNDFKIAAKVSLDEDLLAYTLALFARIQDELKQPFDTLQATILYNYISLILRLIERKYVADDPSKTMAERLKGPALSVKQFKKLVRENYTAHLKIKEYAERLAISERTLQKNVETILGKSPKQLIQEHLLLESKRLLVYENKSVKDIGYTLGFEEPSHFTKFFRNLVGISPTAFKESLAASI